MTDVVMEGVRLMGRCASLICQYGKVADAVAVLDKIGMVALAGLGNKKLYPIVLTAMQQLSKVTLLLLRSEPNNLSYVFKKIKKNVFCISEMFLKVPSGPLEQAHSIYLAPYYSFQSSNLFPSMVNMANAVLDADADNEHAKRIIKNFVTWSDQVYAPERKLFDIAIKAESDLLFHLIEWTKSVGEILVVLSNTPACNDYSKQELQKNAVWLIYNLSWVPDDEKSVSTVANYQFHESLFDVALTGYNRECNEYLEAARQCLLSWAFKGGKYQFGWGMLVLSLQGLAVIALLPGQEGGVEMLVNDVKKKLAVGEIAQENLDRSARALRERAATLYQIEEYTLSKIEMVMKQVDADELKSLLEEIANILSPHTADEEVNVGVF